MSVTKQRLPRPPPGRDGAARPFRKCRLDKAFRGSRWVSCAAPRMGRRGIRRRGWDSRRGPADKTRARRTRPLTPVALIEDTLMFGGTLLVPAWLEAEVESPERL